MSMHSETPKSPIVYQGVVIHERQETLSLTDMWKAAGSPANREPYQWARKEGAAFVDAVALSHNLPVGQVLKSKPGKGGGSFGHWQIGIAYAKYLSPEFHMWCNTVVRERMEGRHGPDPLTAGEHGGITKAVIGKALAETEQRIMAALEGLVTDRVGKVLTSYDPTGGFTTEYAPMRHFIDAKVPNPQGRAPLTRRASNRCVNWLASNGKGDKWRPSRETGRKLFQVDAAREWMSAEGKHMCREHRDKIAGQKVMRFPATDQHRGKGVSSIHTLDATPVDGGQH